MLKFPKAKTKLYTGSYLSQAPLAVSLNAFFQLNKNTQNFFNTWSQCALNVRKFAGAALLGYDTKKTKEKPTKFHTTFGLVTLWSTRPTKGRREEEVDEVRVKKGNAPRVKTSTSSKVFVWDWLLVFVAPLETIPLSPPTVLSFVTLIAVVQSSRWLLMSSPLLSFHTSCISFHLSKKQSF